MRGGDGPPLPLPSLYPKHPLHPCYLNLMYPPNLSPSVRAGLVGLTIFRIFTLKTHPDPTPYSHTQPTQNQQRYNQDTTVLSGLSYTLEVILHKQTRRGKHYNKFRFV